MAYTPRTNHEFLEWWLEDARDQARKAEASLEHARLFSLACRCSEKATRRITTLQSSAGISSNSVGQVLLTVGPFWRCNHK